MHERKCQIRMLKEDFEKVEGYQSQDEKDENPAGRGERVIQIHSDRRYNKDLGLKRTQCPVL